jgi:peptide/nickel transport system permease protein
MLKNMSIQREKSQKWENVKRSWHNYSRSFISVMGIVGILLIVSIAIFANYISPSPESAGVYVNFEEASQPPSLSHICGTDEIGRDILSRIFFGFRISLYMVVIVLSLVVPFGVTMGLIAGYFRNSYIETIIMRITDMFLAIPALLLALVICSLLTPNITNAMLAITVAWWPWYCRVVYGVTTSLKGEAYVWSAEVNGASYTHILFKEILPNCFSPILTKMTLDAGLIILTGATISFVGLGAQPPTPELGSMVSSGCKFLPEQWWISIAPALAIIMVIMCFNFIGDGIVSIFEKGKG